ncbi:MAG: flagellar brake protein [Solirubrobacteraceae bacterium]
MKFGRGHVEEASTPLVLPERSQTVTLVPAGGKGLPARVLERSADALLLAIMVPTEPLSQRQLDGIVVEFLGPQGRVRLSGTATVENPSEPDVLRIDRPRSIEVLQEREYVRIKVARPALVYGAHDQIPIQSFTVDLSGGGFLLAGSDSLSKGDEVQFQLTLTPGELVIGGTGRVVRVDPKGHRAVAFESISEVDRRRLIRFIFDCQRSERHRGLA